MEKTVDKDAVFGVIAAVMSVPKETITDDSSPDTIETWDSVRHMNLVLALEETFEVSFGGDEISEMLSAELVVEIVKEKLGVSSMGA